MLLYIGDKQNITILDNNTVEYIMFYSHKMYYIVLFTHALRCLDMVLCKSVPFVWIWTGNTVLQDFSLGCHHPICDFCVMPMCMLTL